MITDYEYLANLSLGLRQGRPVLIVLTDRRLLVGSFGLLGSRLEWVTECDRLAIKSVTSRQMPRRRIAWLWGAVSTAAIQVEIDGVRNPQQLEFDDPDAMARLFSMLRQQPRLMPARNGIRRIAHLSRRKALKRQYVENLFPQPPVEFVLPLLGNVFLPGLGQLMRHRFRSGSMFLVLFIAVAAALLPVYLAGNSPLGFEQELKVMLAAGMVWLGAIVDLYLHRFTDGHSS